MIRMGCYNPFFYSLNIFNMILKPAQIADLRVRVALCGASGIGKTHYAIEQSKGLPIKGDIAIIDTEAGSAAVINQFATE